MPLKPSFFGITTRLTVIIIYLFLKYISQNDCFAETGQEWSCSFPLCSQGLNLTDFQDVFACQDGGIVTHGGQLRCGPRLFWTGSDVLSFAELRSVWRLFFLWAALPALWEGPAVSVNQTCSTKPGDEHPLVATAGIASVWTTPASSQEKLCSSKGIEGCSQDSHRLPSALRLPKGLLASVFLLRSNLSTGQGRSASERQRLTRDTSFQTLKWLRSPSVDSLSKEGWWRQWQV